LRRCAQVITARRSMAVLGSAEARTLRGMTIFAAFSPFANHPGTANIGRSLPYTRAADSGAALATNGEFVIKLRPLLIPNKNRRYTPISGTNASQSRGKICENLPFDERNSTTFHFFVGLHVTARSILFILFFAEFEHLCFEFIYEELGFSVFEHAFVFHFPDKRAFVIEQQASGRLVLQPGNEIGVFAV